MEKHYDMIVVNEQGEPVMLKKIACPRCNGIQNKVLPIRVLDNTFKFVETLGNTCELCKGYGYLYQRTKRL